MTGKAIDSEIDVGSEGVDTHRSFPTRAGYCSLRAADGTKSIGAGTGVESMGHHDLLFLGNHCLMMLSMYAR